MKTIRILILLAMGSLWTQQAALAQQLGFKQTTLEQWNFSKDGNSFESVTIPHSCNAMDGHSPQYYRGPATYTCQLNIKKQDLARPTFLVFEGAAQAAQVYLNDCLLKYHRGGYTPFVVPLKNLKQDGANEVKVVCDNHEDITLIPVTSDFNKNNGLHNPVYLVQMNEAYFSPSAYGLYRMRIYTPQVSEEQAEVAVKTQIECPASKRGRYQILLQLFDMEGKECYAVSTPCVCQKKGPNTIDYAQNFTVSRPHLWDGINDPYLYKACLTLKDSHGHILDQTYTPIGFRFYEMTKDKGFFLNGHPYPLRGVAMHQDMDGRASAVTDDNLRKDYEFVRELGANFVRLAHYPHRNTSFRLCDSLGLLVQTEIPWVNVCGEDAPASYFENLHSQMREMITNLCNHPSIGFWGMWNELDGWGNKNYLQGKLSVENVLQQTASLYQLAKQLDPYRPVGLTDCSRIRKGYEKLKADYISENRYNGWYQNTFKFNVFTDEMTRIHNIMGVTNVAEYGGGVNPFCHTTDSLLMANRKDDTRHYEEYGNLIHESHVRQIMAMPWLNFTSLWILFDFPVANRMEGFMDSDDGVNFTENTHRKYMNDKGLVTRDRKVKKNVFYLYKSWWNKRETTVHITSSRMHSYPDDRPIYIKVYSNAPSLTLYQNGQKKSTLQSSGESSGLVWTFGPMKFEGSEDVFKVTAPDGTTDEIKWKPIHIARK